MCDVCDVCVMCVCLCVSSFEPSPSLGTPCSSMVVVRAFFLAGPPSDEGCRCFLPSPADEGSSAGAVCEAPPAPSGGGPNGFSSGSSTSGAMGRYSRAL